MGRIRLAAILTAISLLATGVVVAHVIAQAGVRKINGGQTGRIKAGQWIVEQPSTIHQAANKGETRIVIYLATLLKAGAPPSTPHS
jgi:hypothetical protein